MNASLISAALVLAFATPAFAGNRQHRPVHVAQVVTVTPVTPVVPVVPVTPVTPVVPVSPPVLVPVSDRTTLAGDLGLKYNLGRDVNLTAKYGTDSRYGLVLGAQLTPNVGLEAEAYRKDRENAVRVGAIWTLNPIAPPAPVTKIVDRVVDRVVEKPVIKYVDRVKTETVIKMVPYRLSPAPRGRG